MRVSLDTSWSGLVCGAMLLGGCGLCFAIEAIAPAAPVAPVGGAQNSFPYAAILTRNAFGLNPAPLLPGPTPAPGPELAKVIFTGTRKMGSQSWAMFVVKTTDAKKQETTTYLSLAEGETSGPVQLISIRPGGEDVEIVNSGTSMALNMKDNGFEKTGPATAGAPAPPGMRVLTASPGSQWPGAQPQPAAPPAAYDTRAGKNVRYTENVPRSGGIRVGGPMAPPNNPGALTPVAPPTGGMPSNSTPPPTPVGRNPIMPPMPPMPGQ